MAIEPEGLIASRLDRLVYRHAGDMEPVGQGISALRIHFGPSTASQLMRPIHLLTELLLPPATGVPQGLPLVEAGMGAMPAYLDVASNVDNPPSQPPIFMGEGDTASRQRTSIRINSKQNEALPWPPYLFPQKRQDHHHLGVRWR